MLLKLLVWMQIIHGHFGYIDDKQQRNNIVRTVVN